MNNDKTSSAMVITVVGASQGTGAVLVDQALAAGHTVRSVSRRRPSAEGRSHHQSFCGDATDPAVLRAAITGSDAVVVMVGAPARARARVRTAVTDAVIQTMRSVGVRRLMVQSSLGVGDSIKRLGPITHYLVFPFVLKHPMADHTTQEALVRTSGLDWTILRPGYLNDKPSTGPLMAVPTNHPARFSPQVSRAGVATAALGLLADQSTLGAELMLVGAK